MTRGKAIEMCKSIKEYLTGGNPVWSKEEVAEAMTMAIEALSVDMRLERLREIVHEQEEIVMALEEGRLKGCWLTRNGDPTETLFGVYCSECKNWSEYASNYCMNCGADMRGKSE